MLAVRIGLPLLFVAIGAVLIAMGHGRYTSVFASRDSLFSAMGVASIIVAMCIGLLNWMLQMNAQSDDDRAQEEAARQHFLRTGRWPDDQDAR